MEKRASTFEKWAYEVPELPIPVNKISCGIVCMGRLPHLQKTLPKTISGAEAFGMDRVELNILNWNSQDGMHKWITKNYSKLIDEGFIKYVRTTKPKSFHMARTKNIVGRMATGDAVVAADADTWVSGPYLKFVHETLNEAFYPTMIRSFGPHGWMAGRIACHKIFFEQMGGYDERMQKWGSDDGDFHDRFMRMFKGKLVQTPHVTDFPCRRGHTTAQSKDLLVETIEHGSDLRFKNYHDSKTKTLKAKAARASKKRSYGIKKDFNKWIRNENRRKRVTIVNRDYEWGKLPPE